MLDHAPCTTGAKPTLNAPGFHLFIRGTEVRSPKSSKMEGISSGRRPLVWLLDRRLFSHGRSLSHELAEWVRICSTQEAQSHNPCCELSYAQSEME